MDLNNMKGRFADGIRTVNDAKLQGELDAESGETPKKISDPKLQAAYDNVYGRTVGAKDAKYIGQFSVVLEVFDRPDLFKAYYNSFADAAGESDALNSSPPRDFSKNLRLQEIYNQKYKRTAKKLGAIDDITGPARCYSWSEAQKCYDQGRANNVRLIAHSDVQKGEKPSFSNKSDPKLEKIYMDEYHSACRSLRNKLHIYPKTSET